MLHTWLVSRIPPKRRALKYSLLAASMTLCAGICWLSTINITSEYSVDKQSCPTSSDKKPGTNLNFFSIEKNVF